MTPTLTVVGQWDFDPVDDDETSGFALDSDELRARIEGGLAIQDASGVSVSLNGHYDGIGSDDMEAYGRSVRLKIPLN